MEIDRILFPIQSLGPGNRLVIWTVGCSKHCFNCSNEELWEHDDKRNISPDELFELILKSIDVGQIDGITFTGGDPLDPSRWAKCPVPVFKAQKTAGRHICLSHIFN